MEERKKTLKERRADSDKRIVDSAVKCFGEHGFTNCTTNEIAKGAGVTSGLIIQRFETKENLLYFVYKDTMKKFLEIDADYDDISSYLKKIIEQIKNLKQSYPEVFLFIKTVLTTPDLPQRSLKVKYDLFFQMTISKALIKAQDKGVIAKGDLFYLYQAFLSQVFSQIDVCARNNLAYPDSALFLRVFQIVDEEVLKIEKRKQAMLSGLYKTYDTLYYVSIPERTVFQFDYDNWTAKSVDITQAVKDFDDAVNARVVPEYQNVIREFFDRKTINERIGNRKSLSKKCLMTGNREAIISLIPIGRDETGNIVEVMAGLQYIEES